MTKVVIVGDIYNADLTIGGGPMPGGPGIMPPMAPGGGPPPFPGYPAPPNQIWPSPGYPTHPIAPGGPPPGIWGGAPPQVGWPLPPVPPGGIGIWPQPPGGNPPVGGYPGYPAPPNQIWPSPGMPGVSNPMVPPTDKVYVVGWAEGYGATWVKLKADAIEPPPEGETPPDPNAPVVTPHA